MKKVLTPLFAMALILTGAPAAAQNHCFATGPGQMRVALPAGSETSLYVTPDGGIVLDLGETEDTCEGASNNVTESVTVTVPGGVTNETFTLAHNGPGGPFRQQFTADLGEGDDTLAIHGTAGSDRVLASSDQVPGADEIQTNLAMQMQAEDPKRKETSDIIFSSAEELILSMYGLLDIFGLVKGRSSPGSSARSATGPVAVPVVVNGGSGNDKLTGGVAGDRLLGESGNDRLVGGKGKDVLVGGKGDDNCKGGPGKDREKGCE
jgi:Ca2+-binding RTX toxin-like protein